MAFVQGAESLGVAPDQVVSNLGGTTFDVWLNQEAYWANIPAAVWRYKLGGYQ